MKPQDDDEAEEELLFSQTILKKNKEIVSFPLALKE